VKSLFITIYVSSGVILSPSNIHPVFSSKDIPCFIITNNRLFLKRASLRLLVSPPVDNFYDTTCTSSSISYRRLGELNSNIASTDQPLCLASRILQECKALSPFLVTSMRFTLGLMHSHFLEQIFILITLAVGYYAFCPWIEVREYGNITRGVEEASDSITRNRDTKLARRTSQGGAAYRTCYAPFVRAVASWIVSCTGTTTRHRHKESLLRCKT